LALVGDSSDGFPGLKGWGAKSAAAVLLRYGHLEDIPHDHWRWDVEVRGATKLAATLNEQRELAWLFRDLATLRTEPVPFTTVDELRWAGPTPAFDAVAERLNRPQLVSRARALAGRSMPD
jgi:5'-3' exonuclease